MVHGTRDRGFDTELCIRGDPQIIGRYSLPRSLPRRLVQLRHCVEAHLSLTLSLSHHLCSGTRRSLYQAKPHHRA
jgi:hypothetical protein